MFEWSARERVTATAFCRFHDVEGPQMLYVAPIHRTGELNEVFKKTVNLFIPNKSLCNRAISLSVGRSVVIGVPVTINDKNRYARKSFKFCTCFLVPQKPLGEHSHVLVRLAIQTAASFLFLENNFMLLSSTQPEKEAQICALMNQLYLDLNTLPFPPLEPLQRVKLKWQEEEEDKTTDPYLSNQTQMTKSTKRCCSLMCNGSVDNLQGIIMAFNIFVPYTQSRKTKEKRMEIEANQVPIPLVDLNVEILHESPTVSVVLEPLSPVVLQATPFIDGCASAREIAAESLLPVEVVLEYLEHLRYCHLIQIVEKFELNAVFMLSKHFGDVFPKYPRSEAPQKNQMLKHLLCYCTINNVPQEPWNAYELYTVVYQLYCRFDGKTTIGKIAEEEADTIAAQNISLQHLVVFGQMHHLMRKVPFTDDKTLFALADFFV
eukprot:Platyproteum_vivax@DN12783_c0_g1_i1.p1